MGFVKPFMYKKDERSGQCCYFIFVYLTHSMFPQFIDDVCVVCFKIRGFCVSDPAPLVFCEFPSYISDLRMHFYSCNEFPEHKWFSDFNLNGHFNIDVDLYGISYYEMDQWEIFLIDKWTVYGPKLITDLKEYFEFTLFRNLWNNESIELCGLYIKNVKCSHHPCTSYGLDNIWDIDLINASYLFSLQNDYCDLNFYLER